MADIIFRLLLRGAKDLSLHRERDWQTGLSFMDHAYAVEGSKYIRFSIEKLNAEGYIVVTDGEKLARLLPFFGGKPYSDPNFGEGDLPKGHITVYHSDEAYWKAWYLADAANKTTDKISEQLTRFYELRERD